MLCKNYYNRLDSASGHFDISSFITYLNWKFEDGDTEYLAKISTILHEQSHFHQIIGTSYGHFLTDLQDLWVSQLILSVKGAIKNSSLYPNIPTPISKWLKKESNSFSIWLLESVLKLVDSCKYLHSISLEGGTKKDFESFKENYEYLINIKLLLSKQYNWFISEKNKLTDYEVNFEGEEWFGAREIMELQSQLFQLFFLEQHIGKDFNYELNPFIKDLILNSTPESTKNVYQKLRRAIEDENSKILKVISNYINLDSMDSIATIMALCDLSLMPAIGKYQDVNTFMPRIIDILPGFRFAQALIVINKKNILLDSQFNNYHKFIETICIDNSTRWPNPQWLSKKIIKYRQVYNNYGNNLDHKAVFDWQVKASLIRQEKPHIFVYLNELELRTQLSQPYVYYQDHLIENATIEETASIFYRFLSYLTAKVLVEGVGAIEEYSFVPSIDYFVKMKFKRELGINLN